MSEKAAKPYARFDSRWLAAMWEITRFQRLQDPHCTHCLTLHGNIIVEPAAAGGVYIAAASRYGVAVVRDPDGVASRPITFMFPDDLYKAARRPEPVAMPYCGAVHEFDVPEWMQPGDVFCNDVFAFIAPRMIPPRFITWEGEPEFQTPALYVSRYTSRETVIGESYKVTADRVTDWRPALKDALALPLVEAGRLPMSTNAVAMFEPLIQEAALRLGARPNASLRMAGGVALTGLIQVIDYPDMLFIFRAPNAPETDPDIAPHFLEEIA